jgi:hypothetical protein
MKKTELTPEQTKKINSVIDRFEYPVTHRIGFDWSRSRHSVRLKDGILEFLDDWWDPTTAQWRKIPEPDQTESINGLIEFIKNN